MLLKRRYPRFRPRTAPTGDDGTLYPEATQIQAMFTERAERTITVLLIAFVAALACIGYLVGVLVAQQGKATVATYVVEVEAGTGVVRKVTPPDKPYQPELAAIGRQVQDFVKDTYGLSIDPRMIAGAWDRAYGVVTAAGAQRLNVLGAERDPKRWAGKKAIAIDVKRVLHPTATTVDITWVEIVTLEETGAREVFTLANGTKTTERMWSGQFTVMLRPPKDEREVNYNPLGIWIDAWSAVPL